MSLTRAANRLAPGKRAIAVGVSLSEAVAALVASTRPGVSHARPVAQPDIPSGSVARQGDREWDVASCVVMERADYVRVETFGEAIPRYLQTGLREIEVELLLALQDATPPPAMGELLEIDAMYGSDRVRLSARIRERRFMPNAWGATCAVVSIVNGHGTVSLAVCA